MDFFIFLLIDTKLDGAGMIALHLDLLVLQGYLHYPSLMELEWVGGRETCNMVTRVKLRVFQVFVLYSTTGAFSSRWWKYFQYFKSSGGKET